MFLRTICEQCELINAKFSIEVSTLLNEFGNEDLDEAEERGI